MVKTNSCHHQVLNSILNLAEDWIPLTGPSLSLYESRFVEGVAFVTPKSEALKVD